LEIDDTVIGHVFGFATEKQRMLFVETGREHLDKFITFVWANQIGNPSAVRTALDIVLRRKAIGAEALAAQRDAVLGGAYPQLKPQLQQWSNLRAQIAQKQLDGPGAEGKQMHVKLLADWKVKYEQLESDLVRQIPEINLRRQLESADRRAVALHLPEQTALVEFVRFEVFDFRAVAEKVSEDQWTAPQRWKPARYVAFVLPAGEPDNVQMIDLGEAEAIDRMVADFRAGVAGEGRGLGAAQEKAASSFDEHGAKLRQAIFDPLRGALRDRKRVFLSPDGDLTQLPFEVLPTERGSRLIYDYQFSYVAVGRDVLRFGRPSNGEPAKAVVLGDPDFDLDSGPNPLPQSSCTKDEGVKTGRRSRYLDRAKLRFERLAGTRTECEHIVSLLEAELWLDRAALETRLKACRSPRILHLATHGFFLEDQKHDSRGWGASSSFVGSEIGRFSGPALENPLLRSGLALAGVNTWLKNGRVAQEAEDGLLTAEDVASMDLLDTDLVVLSACETGLGEVHIGEGVMGLRRSFALAGAKTLVMSLWNVPDIQTQQLMEIFYRRVMAGEGRAEALRNAQLVLKAKYPDPLYWGAFICQGDPGPLPGEPKPAA
jgi:CHAT domain-containing protein